MSSWQELALLALKEDAPETYEEIVRDGWLAKYLDDKAEMAQRAYREAIRSGLEPWEAEEIVRAQIINPKG